MLSRKRQVDYTTINVKDDKNENKLQKEEDIILEIFMGNELYSEYLQTYQEKFNIALPVVHNSENNSNIHDNVVHDDYDRKGDLRNHHNDGGYLNDIRYLNINNLSILNIINFNDLGYIADTCSRDVNIRILDNNNNNNNNNNHNSYKQIGTIDFTIINRNLLKLNFTDMYIECNNSGCDFDEIKFEYFNIDGTITNIIKNQYESKYPNNNNFNNNLIKINTGSVICIENIIIDTEYLLLTSIILKKFINSLLFQHDSIKLSLILYNPYSIYIDKKTGYNRKKDILCIPILEEVGFFKVPLKATNTYYYCYLLL